ncbi:hypothetical protein NECAME_17323 [Necator americanus]|uniref:Uncharacterized protein n=1 Tax=Necator americanus TaxID=51031 RepID=W2TS65_NECAM|nr:hypothetical protein NECAME_17323 [Necator americanus]ETN83842.1 hypothetical protein NECAME_17323 [Necator americanus]
MQEFPVSRQINRMLEITHDLEALHQPSGEKRIRSNDIPLDRKSSKMQCDPIVYDVSNVSSYVVNAMGSRCLSVSLPMEFYAVIGTSYPYEFGEWICKGRAYLIEFTSYASILVICSFTVERWLAIWLSSASIAIRAKNL